ERMAPAVHRGLQRSVERLIAVEKLRLSLNPDGPLSRGFARVHHADGRLVRGAGLLTPGEEVRMHFADGDRQAVVEGTPHPTPASAPRAPRAKAEAPDQGNLF
ncbi:MAG TPA: exodeoxyribonuclease VII large subunit, partial [Caulobacteraceae bacterium]